MTIYTTYTSSHLVQFQIINFSNYRNSLMSLDSIYKPVNNSWEGDMESLQFVVVKTKFAVTVNIIAHYNNFRSR